MSPKRKPRVKDKNYSDSECRELYKILKKYVHIIECKTNAETKNDEKNLTWNTICREFNSITSQNRSTESLRRKWKNDKSYARLYLQSKNVDMGTDSSRPKFVDTIIDILGEHAHTEKRDKNAVFTKRFQSTKQSIDSEDEDDIDMVKVESVMLDEDEFDELNVESMDINYSKRSTAKQNAIDPEPAKRLKILNGSDSQNAALFEDLQIQLLRKQIEVQDLLAMEVRAKIEKINQQMELEKRESELRCKEMQKRSK